jgi:hypothetical protein
VPLASRRAAAGGLAGCWAGQLAGFAVEGLGGDLVAEVAELADVVADLAVAGALLLVLPGAEVAVSGTGVDRSLW